MSRQYNHRMPGGVLIERLGEDNFRLSLALDAQGYSATVRPLTAIRGRIFKRTVFVREHQCELMLEYRDKQFLVRNSHEGADAFAVLARTDHYNRKRPRPWLRWPWGGTTQRNSK